MIEQDTSHIQNVSRHITFVRSGVKLQVYSAFGSK